MNATFRTASLLLIGATALLTAGSAVAQDIDYRVLVLRGEIDDVSDQEGEDIVEESAYLIEDFGGFEVYRYYELEGEVGDDMADDIFDCDEDVECLIDELDGSPFDYTMVVNIAEDGNDIGVHYVMIDVIMQEVATEQFAYLPTATDFAYLMVPNHECLKVTPEWQDQGPIETEVEVDGEEIEDPLLTELPPTSDIEDEDRDRDRDRSRDRGRDRSGGLNLGVPHYLAIGGAAVFTGGVFFGFAADSTQQTIQSTPHPGTEVMDLQSSGRTQQALANTFFIVGGGALVTGVTMLILNGGNSDTDDDDDDWSVQVDPLRRWVGVSGTF